MTWTVHASVTNKHYFFPCASSPFLNCLLPQCCQTNNLLIFSQTIFANNGTGGLRDTWRSRNPSPLRRRRCTRRGPRWGRRPTRRRGWRRRRATISWGQTGRSTSKSATSLTPTSGEQTAACPLLVVSAWGVWCCVGNFGPRLCFTWV
jgi:hypothetical protein